MRPDPAPHPPALSRAHPQVHLGDEEGEPAHGDGGGAGGGGGTGSVQVPGAAAATAASGAEAAMMVPVVSGVPCVGQWVQAGVLGCQRVASSGWL